MKKHLLIFFGLASAAIAMPPGIGTTSDNVTFAYATNFNGSTFGTLTDSNLASQEGKVIMIAYVAPW